MIENPFINLGIDFSADSELEIYRATTLFTKEPETIAWIDSWKDSDNSCFYDVGANIGIYSFYASAKHRSLRVLAMEPESKNYTALCRNNLQNSKFRVEPFRFAISDSTGIIKLAVTDERVGNSNSQIDITESHSTQNIPPVRFDSVLCTSIDFLVKEMNFPPPNYLKIDVDGHESSILKGASEVMKNTELKTLLVEFNDLSSFQYWSSTLKNFGLEIDDSFDQVVGHSTGRRKSNGTEMRNVIFSRR
jgi:FkbM family methyltransferase